MRGFVLPTNKKKTHIIMVISRHVTHMQVSLCVLGLKILSAGLYQKLNMDFDKIFRAYILQNELHVLLQRSCSVIYN